MGGAATGGKAGQDRKLALLGASSSVGIKGAFDVGVGVGGEPGDTICLVPTYWSE